MQQLVPTASGGATLTPSSSQQLNYSAQVSPSVLQPQQEEPKVSASEQFLRDKVQETWNAGVGMTEPEIRQLYAGQASEIEKNIKIQEYATERGMSFDQAQNILVTQPELREPSTTMGNNNPYAIVNETDRAAAMAHAEQTMKTAPQEYMDTYSPDYTQYHPASLPSVPISVKTQEVAPTAKPITDEKKPMKFTPLEAYSIIQSPQLAMAAYSGLPLATVQKNLPALFKPPSISAPSKISDTKPETIYKELWGMSTPKGEITVYQTQPEQSKHKELWGMSTPEGEITVYQTQPEQYYNGLDTAPALSPSLISAASFSFPATTTKQISSGSMLNLGTNAPIVTKTGASTAAKLLALNAGMNIIDATGKPMKTTYEELYSRDTPRRQTVRESVAYSLHTGLQENIALPVFNPFSSVSPSGKGNAIEGLNIGGFDVPGVSIVRPIKLSAQYGQATEELYNKYAPSGSLQRLPLFPLYFASQIGAMPEFGAQVLSGAGAVAAAGVLEPLGAIPKTPLSPYTGEEQKQIIKQTVSNPEFQLGILGAMVAPAVLKSPISAKIGKTISTSKNLPIYTDIVFKEPKGMITVSDVKTPVSAISKGAEITKLPSGEYAMFKTPEIPSGVLSKASAQYSGGFVETTKSLRVLGQDFPLTRSTAPFTEKLAGSINSIGYTKPISTPEFGPLNLGEPKLIQGKIEAKIYKPAAIPETGIELQTINELMRTQPREAIMTGKTGRAPVAIETDLLSLSETKQPITQPPASYSAVYGKPYEAKFRASPMFIEEPKIDLSIQKTKTSQKGYGKQLVKKIIEQIYPTEVSTNLMTQQGRSSLTKVLKEMNYEPSTKSTFKRGSMTDVPVGGKEKMLLTGTDTQGGISVEAYDLARQAGRLTAEISTKKRTIAPKTSLTIEKAQIEIVDKDINLKKPKLMSEGEVLEKYDKPLNYITGEPEFKYIESGSQPNIPKKTPLIFKEKPAESLPEMKDLGYVFKDIGERGTKTTQTITKTTPPQTQQAYAKAATLIFEEELAGRLPAEQSFTTPKYISEALGGVVATKQKEDLLTLGLGSKLKTKDYVYFGGDLSKAYTNALTENKNIIKINTGSREITNQPQQTLQRIGMIGKTDFIKIGEIERIATISETGTMQKTPTTTKLLQTQKSDFISSKSGGMPTPPPPTIITPVIPPISGMPPKFIDTTAEKKRHRANIFRIGKYKRRRIGVAPDFISQMRSESMFGKSTAVLASKNPEILKYGTNVFGYVPTKELLHTGRAARPGATNPMFRKNKIQRISSIFKMPRIKRKRHKA